MRRLLHGTQSGDAESGNRPSQVWRGQNVARDRLSASLRDVAWRGGAYKTADRTHAEHTRGFRRAFREFGSKDSTPKMVWMKRLHKDARELLRGGDTPPELKPFERAFRDGGWRTALDSRDCARRSWRCGRSTTRGRGRKALPSGLLSGNRRLRRFGRGA